MQLLFLVSRLKVLEAYVGHENFRELPCLLSASHWVGCGPESSDASMSPVILESFL